MSSEILLQGITIIPTVPKDGTLTIMEMCAFYNDFAHPQALFETVEGVSGFLEDNIPDGRVLKDFINNLPEEMCSKPVGAGEVCIALAHPM